LLVLLGHFCFTYSAKKKKKKKKKSVVFCVLLAGTNNWMLVRSPVGTAFAQLLPHFSSVSLWSTNDHLLFCGPFDYEVLSSVLAKTNILVRVLEKISCAWNMFQPADELDCKL
jgi:hypothetical protein